MLRRWTETAVKHEKNTNKSKNVISETVKSSDKTKHHLRDIDMGPSVYLANRN